MEAEEEKARVSLLHDVFMATGVFFFFFSQGRLIRSLLTPRTHDFQTSRPSQLPGPGAGPLEPLERRNKDINWLEFVVDGVVRVAYLICSQAAGSNAPKSKNNRPADRMFFQNE